LAFGSLARHHFTEEISWIAGAQSSASADTVSICPEGRRFNAQVKAATREDHRTRGASHR
jgi:hypothetical protein